MTTGPTDSDRPTVTVRLGGRLGNQMFQYAAGAALAERLCANLACEGLPPESGAKSRAQVLEAFGLHLPFRPYRKRRGDKLLNRLAQHGIQMPMLGCRRLVERHFHYDPSVETVGGNLLMIGGWQSERYFASIGERIRSIFGGEPKLSAHGFTVRQQIDASALSVAIHLRRGDYASNPRILARHGLCTRDYYLRALDYLVTSGVVADRLFVFSDEPERAFDELGDVPRTIFVRDTSQEEDLFLMSRCRHNIIANSTYSWWAAWLNPRSDKLVIAPRDWFGPRLAELNDTCDLFPASWVKI